MAPVKKDQMALDAVCPVSGVSLDKMRAGLANPLSVSDAPFQNEAQRRSASLQPNAFEPDRISDDADG